MSIFNIGKLAYELVPSSSKQIARIDKQIKSLYS